jgi:hypothetical protein
LSKRTGRVDPTTVQIVVETALEPNFRNPYSQMTPEQREDTMRDLIRRIKSRQVSDETNSEKT